MVVYCCVEYIELTIFPGSQISIASLKDQPISVALTGNPAFVNYLTIGSYPYTSLAYEY